MTLLRRRQLLLALTPLVGVGAVGSYLALHLAPKSFERTEQVPDDRIGGPFELVDHTGRTVTDATFRGRLMLVYFGYTGCADLCSANLAGLSTALEQLGADAAQVAFLFITVDPAQDTKARLAGFVGHYHPQLIGLTGSTAQCARAAAAFHVHAKPHAIGATGEYVMDHSTFAYLMGRDGQLLALFKQSTSPREIAAAIRQHL